MNIYFFRSNKENNKTLDRAEDILRLRNIRVITNREKSEAQFKTEDIIESKRTGTSLTSRIDAFVLDITDPCQEIGYFLALAVLYKKWILCLYSKSENPTWFEQFKQHISDYKKVTIKAYTRSSITKIIQEFLKSFDIGSVDNEDVPSLKFTLRISPRMERYLRWKTINTKDTKADFLRKEIQRMMNEDEKYNEY